MAALGVIPLDALDSWAARGELSLDGRIVPAAGALPTAMAAGAMGLGLSCPKASGSEAAGAGGTHILAPRSLVALINHFRGSQVLSAPAPGPVLEGERAKDRRNVKGQEHAKRALEIAAAGGHNLLNGRAEGAFVETIADLDEAWLGLLARAAQAGRIRARGWTRVLRLARTIADLEGHDGERRIHVAEALAHRRTAAAGEPADLSSGQSVF